MLPDVTCPSHTTHAHNVTRSRVLFGICALRLPRADGDSCTTSTLEATCLVSDECVRQSVSCQKLLHQECTACYCHSYTVSCVAFSLTKKYNITSQYYFGL